MSDDRYDPVSPGEVLREEFLEPLGITAYRLAAATGMSQTRISQMLRGQRSVTADSALRLGAALGTSAQFWINLQSQYEVARERMAHDAEYAAITPLVEA